MRTPAECTEVHEQNTELNISLLDQRFLAGDRALYAALAEKLPRFLAANRDALMRNLARLARERHAKFADTFYHLEPNVKETPGGLRDYQLICWLEQLRAAPARRRPNHSGDPGRPSTSWRGCAATCTANRAATTTCFPSRRRIRSPTPGDGDTAAGCASTTAMRAPSTAPPCAPWMLPKRRPAACWRSSATGARAFPTPISACTASGPISAPRSSLDPDPELVLRLFEFVARHGIRPSFEAEQQIAARLPRLREYFATPRPMWPALDRILSLPHAPLAAARHARNRRADGPVPRAGGDRVPGGARLLPPLHRG